MRVLHVIAGLDQRYGGPTSSLIGLAGAQQEAGLNVAICATHHWDLPPWPELDRLSQQGCEIRLVDFTRPSRLRLKELSDQLASDIQRANLVHIHGLWNVEQHLAATYARQFGRKYIIRPCGMLSPWSMSQKRLKKAVYYRWRLRKNLKHASLVHFTTRRERTASRKYSGQLPAVIEPSGINQRDFVDLPEKGTFLKQHSIDQSQGVILFVGRIHPVKGLELLLEAVSRLPRGTLALVGPDSDGHARQLEQLAQHLGITDRVRMVGPVYGEARISAFRDADAFVLPSHHENFGLAVIEALACGTPVVISEHVDLAEDLDSTEVCAVVPRDVQRLTAAIEHMVPRGGNDAIRELCREIAFDRYAWSEIGKRWISHYERLL